MNKCLLALLMLLSANIFLTSCADDQARAAIGDTNARLSLLEQNVGLLGTKVSNQRVLDLLNKVDDLQSQLNDLNGEVSTLKQNQQSGLAMQEQINQGLQSQIEQSSVIANKGNGQSDAGNVVSVVKASDVTKEQNQLDLALKRLKAHDFSNAIKQFKAIIAAGADQQIVADASYYLAVSYVANKQYKSAMVVAKKFVAENSQHEKSPDALRIIYISQTQLGMANDAAITAKLLVKKYPNSTAAKKL